MASIRGDSAGRGAAEMFLARNSATSEADSGVVGNLVAGCIEGRRFALLGLGWEGEG